jgi:streptogramin lyase
VLLDGFTGVQWTVTTNVPWLHVLGSTSGNGRATIIFTYDANPGPTRVGILDVAGETVTVTQAGTNYVQAPGPLTGLVTNGISAPYGIAVDDNGDVFFADSGNGAIKRWNRTANTVSTLTSGWSSPYGLGLDGLGNVYFAQWGNAAIKKRFATFPFSTVTLFNNDTTGVAGLAVDEAANVYITVPGEHAVKKWDASTSTLTSYTTNGLISPFGVAVDKTGQLYASDIGDHSVKKLGFTIIIIFGHPVFVANWNTLTIVSNLFNPYNLAVDDGGNLFIADYSHGAIKKYSVASNTVTTAVSGLVNPTGVAVDKTGNLFVADWIGDAIKEQPYAFVDPTPQNEPAEVTTDKLPVILMPDENLLPPFAPTPNSPWIFYGGSTTGVVQFAVGANVGGPRSGSITVLGQPITINQDGASRGVGTTSLLVGPAAGSNTVAEFVIPTIASWSASSAAAWLHVPVAGGTGSGNILFTYDANPGATRSGKLSINGKTVVVTQAGSTYVQAPGPLTTLVSAGLVSPVDLAVDTAGDIIFSDSGNNTVKEWVKINNTVSNVITSGLSTPQAVAVDGAGNVYLDDFFNHAIKKRQASDGSIITLVNDSPNAPSGLALDSSTNVYWSGATDNAVKKWTASSGTVSTIVSSGLSGPFGLDLDIGGAVYIADHGNNAIKKWNPATASVTTLTTSGIGGPWGVAVDGSGNVYVANGGVNNNIVEWVAASGNVVTRVITGGVNNPTDVDVDANQNIYIADFGHALIKELPYAFVDPTPQFEPATAGSDSLPVVLPPSQNLLPPFAPTSSQPWLTIGAIVGGVVNFDFTANPGTLPRNATITLLGQNIPVQQAATVFPPLLMSLNKSNDVFQFSFTNGTPGATYSVLFTTDVTTPLAGWSVIGTALQVGPDLWQFTDNSASNSTRFYLIRSP